MNSLHNKLKALQKQSGVIEEATPQDAALSQRLSELKQVRERKERSAAKNESRLAELLGGEVISSGLIKVTRQFEIESSHGHVNINHPSKTQALELWGQDNAIPNTPVFMDTETTGLAGGTGTLAFLLGMARFRDQHLEVCQLFLTGFSGESAMLAEAESFVSGCDGMVTFNGKSFDHPLVQTRCKLTGRSDPFASLPHLDLLHPVRRVFKTIWSDCKLQTTEKQLLGFHRTDDLPGYLVPDAWFAWVRHGKHDELPRVMEHNQWDLVSLAALVPALGEVLADPVANHADILGQARYCKRTGNEARAIEHLQAGREQLNESGLLELALLAKRREDWPQAIEIWELLAAKNNIEAVERLAKYQEHQARNLESALDWARKLNKLLPANNACFHRERRLLDKLSRRCTSER